MSLYQKYVSIIFKNAYFKIKKMKFCTKNVFYKTFIY